MPEKPQQKDKKATITNDQCCRDDKLYRGKTNKLDFLYKRPDIFGGYGYNMKKKAAGIKQLQNFFNRPIDRKLYIPRARTKQLALPKVRKLLAAKAEYKDYLNSTWQIRYDDLIQKSCGTIYSQLAKISLPPKTDEVKKWTEKDWAMHNAWLDLRAKPKTYDKPPRKRRKVGDMKILIPACTELALPKYITPKFDPNCEDTFTDPITKLKLGTVKFEANENPWYKCLDDKLKELLEYGKQKQQEIFEATHLLPNSNWQPGWKYECEPPFLDKLVEYPNKTALNAMKARDMEEQKSQEHYKKIVDRKFIQIPPSQLIHSLATKPNWMFEYVELEKQHAVSDFNRYKRASDRTKIKKKPKKRISRLAKWPSRVAHFINFEQDAVQEATARYKIASDRTRIKSQPSERTLELALLTKQLLKKHQEWYENWKQRDEEMEKFFTPTKNAMQYQMPKHSRLLELARPKNPKPKIERGYS